MIWNSIWKTDFEKYLSQSHEIAFSRRFRASHRRIVIQEVSLMFATTVFQDVSLEQDLVAHLSIIRSVYLLLKNSTRLVLTLVRSQLY